MAAIVIVEEMTGPTASPIFTFKDTTTGSRYYTADESGSSLTTYPIPIPTNDGGVSGSYWKTHLINVTSAPSQWIKNIRYYQTWSSSPKADWNLGSSNTWPAGLYIGVSSATLEDCKSLTQGFHSGSYARASGTQGTCGYLISGNHSYYANIATAMSGGWCPIDAFDSVSNAYMVYSGTAIYAPTTSRCYCIVTQVLVGSGATQGEKADRTATYVYSEV